MYFAPLHIKYKDWPFCCHRCSHRINTKQMGSESDWSFIPRGINHFCPVTKVTCTWPPPSHRKQPVKPCLESHPWEQGHGEVEEGCTRLNWLWGEARGAVRTGNPPESYGQPTDCLGLRLCVFLWVPARTATRLGLRCHKAGPGPPCEADRSSTVADLKGWDTTGTDKLLQQQGTDSGVFSIHLPPGVWELTSELRGVPLNLNLCWCGWTAISSKYHSRDKSHWSQWSTPHISNLCRTGVVPSYPSQSTLGFSETICYSHFFLSFRLKSLERCQRISIMQIAKGKCH